MNAFPYHSDPEPAPSSLPYWPLGYHDTWSEYRNKQKNSKEKEEIHGMYEGDTADW